MDAALHFLRNHLVTAAVALPLAGALFAAAVPSKRRSLLFSLATAFSAMSLIACVSSFAVVRGTGEIELMDLAAWIPSIGAHYRVGADGVSALFMCLAASVSLLSIAASAVEIRSRTNLFLCMALVFQSAAIGLFAAMDALLFLVFWAVSAGAIACMTGISGRGDRASAAARFAVFSAAGIASASAAFAFIAHAAGSFDIIAWYSAVFEAKEQVWIFAALAVGFGIFLPIAGLHGWLRDAASGSATAVSMLATGVLVKIGAYGFYRIAMPMAPDAVRQLQPIMLAVAIAGVAYGAALVYSRRDIPGIVAAATISQSGLVLLGLFSLHEYGAAGAVLLAVSSGLAAAGLIFVSSRAAAFPSSSAMFFVAVLAFAGAPGLAVFSGLSVLLLGAFQTKTTYAAVAAAGAAILAAGLVVMAAKFINMPEGVEGRTASKFSRVRGAAIALSILFALAAVGVWPESLMGRIYRPARAFVKLSSRVRMIIPAKPSDRAGLDGNITGEAFR